MGDLANFTSALLGAVDTGNDFYAKKMEEQAKFDASNISIRLQREANNKLLEMQQTNDFDKWSSDMDTFFEQTLQSMENKNSPYYCRNAQTAKYVNEIIEQSRNNYQFKVDQMVVEKQREMNIANYNQRCNDIDAMYSGQENIDLKNAGAKLMLEKGDIDVLKYQELTEKNYWTGAYNNCVNNFNDSLIDTAIKAGKDFNETWKSYSAAVEMPKKYGIDGFEVAGNNKEILEKAQKECEQKYNSSLYTMQQKNYDYHEQNLTKGIRLVTLALEGQPVNLNDIYSIVNTGQLELSRMGGIQLAAGQQKALSKEYEGLINTLKAIEKAEKSGSGSKSNPSFATSVYVKEMPDNYFGMLKDGTFKNPQAMKDGLDYALREAFNEGQWKETEGMTQQQKEEWYNKNYSNFAMNKILDSKILDETLKNEYPEIYVEWNLVKEDVKQDIKKNPDPSKRKYTENGINTLGEAIYNLMASSGKDTDKTVVMKDFRAKKNAIMLDGLNGLFKGRGFFESEQKYLARTSNEMKNNDVVFTNVYGEERWIPGTKEKVDAVAKDQKSYIETALGIDLETPVYKKVDNDIDTLPEFKASDGNTYHIEANDDGKTVKIVDQNGIVHDPLNKKDLRTLDKEKKAELAAAEKETHKETIEKEAAANNSLNSLITQNTNISNVVKNVGKVSEEQWKASAGNTTERQILLTDTVNKINKLEKKLNDNDFLKQVGITKEKWNTMTGNAERFKFLMS